MPTPQPQPQPLAAPQSRGLRLSLRWKAFGLLLLLLTMIGVALALYGYRSLVRESEREFKSHMRAFPANLDEQLAQKADDLAQIGGMLAAGVSIQQLSIPGAADAMLGPQLLADILAIEFLGPDGRWLGGVPADAGQSGLSRHAAQAVPVVLPQIAQNHRPDWRVSCAPECRQVVFVPVFDRESHELVIVLSVAVTDALLSFAQQRGVDVALLLPLDAARDGMLARFDDRALVAVTHAPTLLPRLRKLDAQAERAAMPAGALFRVSSSDRELLMMRAPLRGHAGEVPVELLFIADQTAVIRRIARELQKASLVTLGGLVFSGVLLYLLVSPTTLRLRRVTQALPLLAERRYAESRSQLGAVAAARILPDEIDALRDTALWLTDRLQQLDAAEAASAAKSRFLAAMSHEIRTPMNGVMGMLEMLEQSPLNDRQRQDVHVARESAQALLRVIDDILDFSKIEAGKLDIEEVPFSPAEALEGTLETLAPALRSRRVRLLSYVDPALPPQVGGDSLRLRQILFNLAGNALKFTEEGCVLVRADRVPAPRGQVMVRFEVRDTGIGIGPEALRSLFQPFFQAESSTTRRYGGSGLGLSISRGLVERMGGQLRVESKPGQGSRFWFRLGFAALPPPQVFAAPLPLAGVRVDCRLADGEEAALIHAYAAAAGAEVTADELVAPAPGSVCVRIADLVEAERAVVTRGGSSGLRLCADDGKVLDLRRPYRRTQLVEAIAEAAGKAPAASLAIEEPGLASAAPPASAARLLVAEDHPVNRRVIRTQLERLGYAAEVVADGEEALRRLEAGSYDLLITDLQMPGLNGLQLTARQRQREGRGESPGRLPIVALTANALPGEAQRCIAAGMDDYLSKPMLLAQLQACLQRWLPANPEAAPPAAAAAVPASAAVATPPLRAPVVDVTLLRECFGDDPQAIRALLGEFLRINAPLIAELQALLPEAAADVVQALTHRLLGSARTAGAQRLGDVLARVETAVRSGAPRAVWLALGGEIAYEFARVRTCAERLSAAGSEAAPG